MTPRLSPALARRIALYNSAFEQHYVALWRYAEALVLIAEPEGVIGDDDIEDIVADAFTRAWRRTTTRHTPNLTWLRRTVDNNVRGRVRRMATRTDARAIIEANAASMASGSEVRERAMLRRAFSRLSRRDRQVLAARYWEELSGGEIAERMGMSDVAVRKALSRATGRLRDELARTKDEMEQATGGVRRAEPSIEGRTVVTPVESIPGEEASNSADDEAIVEPDADDSASGERGEPIAR